MGINMRRVKRNDWKGTTLAVTALATLLLTGCGEQNPEDVWRDAHTSTEKSDYIAEESIESDSNTAEAGVIGEADHSGEQALYQGTYRSCIIQEDEEYLYLCGAYRVSRINKETGKVEVLWENAEQVDSCAAYLYSEGSGLLLNDRIYFIERWYEDDEQHRALSFVFKDGSSYERVTELGTSYSDGMLLQDGTLYIDDDGMEVWYQMYADGTVSNRNVLLVEDVNQLFYNRNGGSVVFHEEQITIPEGYYMNSLNEEYILVLDYVSGVRTILTLIDRDTLEERQLIEIEDSFSVLNMDDANVYILRTDYEKETIDYTYERIDLETGEREELFTQEKSGFAKYVSSYLMDVVVQGDYIYYADEEDWNYYLMRRNVNDPEKVEKVGDAFYESGVGEVGSVQYLYEEFYSEKNDEEPVYVMDMAWLQVDEKFPGANDINAYLNDYINSQRDYIENDVAEMEEWIEADEIGVPSEISSKFFGFDYRDDHYISYCQTEYYYPSGAAHGMPCWVGYTFDLQTGDRLLLTDVIGNSEEELREIVTAYFTEKINKNPEYFWDDAIDYVNEHVNFESDFYLTKQGIVFYYGPYDLACYAAGFQYVTIPYEEFEMKITLE